MHRFLSAVTTTLAVICLLSGVPAPARTHAQAAPSAGEPAAAPPTAPSVGGPAAAPPTAPSVGGPAAAPPTAPAAGEPAATPPVPSRPAAAPPTAPAPSKPAAAPAARKPAATPPATPAPREPAATPPAAPAAGAPAAQVHADPPEPPNEGVEVRLHETTVLRLYTDRPHQPAAVRARTASAALAQAARLNKGEVRVDPHRDVRVIFVGEIPIVELYEADARAAHSASLDVYTANVAAQMSAALSAERRRNALAATVFSISLIVFSGFIALYVLRKLGVLANRARDLIVEHPERIDTIRLNTLQIIGAGPLRVLLLVAVVFGRWVLQLVVVYVWLALSLSRFELTRPFTDALNRTLIDPLSGLMQRTFGALPILVLSFGLIAAVFVLVRFVDLFFRGASHTRERAAWVPRDLLAPTSAIIRIMIVLMAMLFAGPIVSGDPAGLLARFGTGVLLGLSLAVTPLLCTIVCGAVQIFTRRLHVGGHIELGGYRGRVVRIGLLDMLLRGVDGSELRVPHLRALVTPVRLLAEHARRSVEVCVAPGVAPATVVELFASALRTPGGIDEVRVELLSIDADGARYRASVPDRDARSQSDLLLSLANVMQREGIGYGRSSQAGRAHG